MGTIRIATVQDLSDIVRLEQDWVQEGLFVGFKLSGVEGFTNYIVQADKSVWVAEMHNEIVGYVTTSIYKTSELAVVPSEEAYIEIDDLYVSPEHRSKTIGSKMVEAVLEFARAQMIRHATVFTASSRVVDIMRFYKNQGFQSWGIQFYRRI